MPLSPTESPVAAARRGPGVTFPPGPRSRVAIFEILILRSSTLSPDVRVRVRVRTCVGSPGGEGYDSVLR